MRYFSSIMGSWVTMSAGVALVLLLGGDNVMYRILKGVRKISTRVV